MHTDMHIYTECASNDMEIVDLQSNLHYCEGSVYTRNNSQIEYGINSFTIELPSPWFLKKL